MNEKSELLNRKEIPCLSKSILHTLLYYDIFSYPLTPEEVYINLNTNHVSSEEVKKELEKLRSDGLLISRENFFMLKNDEELISKRLKGNRLAEKKLHTAFRMSGIISKFPFVRSILLSGSISKGYMENDSDIDFFIITHPDRVWLSKFLLMLFKKVFLLNSKKNFCINYFIDTEKLEIDEKNIFTATELTTLIPTFGSRFYHELYNKNIWIKGFYPNFPKRTSAVPNKKDGIIKSSVEIILGGKFGDKLDDYSMALFKKFNETRYKDYNPKEFGLAFKMTKKESKHHPKFFQKRVLEAFNEKIKSFEQKHNLSLS